MLAVVETHPIQYHAPLYRMLQADHGIAVTAVYGSDFSVAGYHDREFDASFSWDSDLLSGYNSVFLSRVSEGGARTPNEVSAAGLGRVLRALKPSAILIGGYNLRIHHLSMYHAWRLKLPLLFRGETTDHARDRSFLKGALRDFTLRLAYRRCDSLLYIGQQSHLHFKRLSCPDEKLWFSPYCVDTAPFETGERARQSLRPSTRSELGVKDNQIVLLFSGKLSTRKGPLLLIEAVRRLPPNLRDRIVVLFVGSGELAAELKMCASCIPAVSAIFVGFKNQTLLSQYYHASDLLVLPSRCSETWGLVVNDALHHGLPCIVSSSVGCASDLIVDGSTGSTFLTGSADSLATSIQRWTVLQRDQSMREHCRRLAANYSAERAAAGIASAFLSLQNSAKAPQE